LTFECARRSALFPRTSTCSRRAAHVPNAMTTVNFYPFLNLTSSPSFLAFSTGPTLRIFSPSSGELLCSSPSQSAHSGLVRLVAISKDEKWITTVADDKVVKVWEVLEQGKALKCSSSRCVSSWLEPAERKRVLTRLCSSWPLGRLRRSSQPSPSPLPTTLSSETG
jgi:WD40 repeat protein